VPGLASIRAVPGPGSGSRRGTSAVRPGQRRCRCQHHHHDDRLWLIIVTGAAALAGDDRLPGGAARARRLRPSARRGRAGAGAGLPGCWRPGGANGELGKFTAMTSAAGDAPRPVRKCVFASSDRTLLVADRESLTLADILPLVGAKNISPKLRSLLASTSARPAPRTRSNLASNRGQFSRTKSPRA